MTDTHRTTEPAIPPQEWKAQLARSPEERRRHLLWAKDEVDADGYLNIPGLAAVALYGQPYGFTREDVELLRAIEVVQLKTTDVPYHVAANPGQSLNSLADRIEALLPPSS